MKSSTQTEADLNNYYSNCFSEEEAVDSLIYLTNKSRGKSITKKALIVAYHQGSMGTLLKKYDSIAFNCARTDN